MRSLISSPGGFVYLVEAQNGLLKIGHGCRPYERLSAIRTHSPIPCRMVAFWEASREVEKALHEQLTDHRSHGEWFSIVGPVADLVSLKTGVGVGAVEDWSEVLFGPNRRATIIANAEKRRSISRALKRGETVSAELMEFYNEPKRSW